MMLSSTFAAAAAMSADFGFQSCSEGCLGDKYGNLQIAQTKRRDIQEQHFNQCRHMSAGAFLASPLKSSPVGLSHN